MCETILTDTDAAARVSAKLSASDRGLWQQVTDKIREWFDGIRKFYSGVKLNSDLAEGGRELISRNEAVLNVWVDAAAGAVENYRGEVRTEDARESEQRNSVREDIVDVNGKEYNAVVQLDKPVPKRVLNDQRSFSRFLVQNLFNKKIPVTDSNGEIEILEFAKENERVRKQGNVHPVRGELERAIGDVRRKIIVNLEEVAVESKFDPEFSNSSSSHGWLDQNGWESRKAFVTDGDTVFSAYLKIGRAYDGRNILYAVNCDIKNGIAVDKSATRKRAAVLPAMPSGNKIAQDGRSVNQKVLNSDRDTDLSTENARLKADVANLRELVKMQGKLTGGKIWTGKSLNTAANFLRGRPGGSWTRMGRLNCPGCWGMPTMCCPGRLIRILI